DITVNNTGGAISVTGAISAGSHIVSLTASTTVTTAVAITGKDVNITGSTVNLNAGTAINVGSGNVNITCNSGTFPAAANTITSSGAVTFSYGTFASAASFSYTTPNTITGTFVVAAPSATSLTVTGLDTTAGSANLGISSGSAVSLSGPIKAGAKS